MGLSADQVSKNYEECYQLTARLLKQKYNRRGFEADAGQHEFVDLCQSVIGHETVVLLLQNEIYDPSIYGPVLEPAIDEVKRAFFPDTSKRRFVSIDALEMDLPAGEPAGETNGFTELAYSEPEILGGLRESLSADSFAYLKNILLPQMPDWAFNLQFLIRSLYVEREKLALESIENKITLLRKFYPDGIINYTAGLEGLDGLSDEQVVSSFLNVYIGIESSFQVNFLQCDGEKRAALVVRFLIEKILNTCPEAVLEQKDETFFIRHKLQNVYRFFNYSANRALGNAYPELIPPWLHSRSSARYWDNAQNRIEAIRWLVEYRLQLSPEELYKNPVSKEEFARQGLSYMFNQFYNSVSKSLADAYPHLEPWEIGKVPSDYWNKETIAKAVRWMVAKKGWKVGELPAKVRSKEFNRKTFSEFGLATLFEKKFAKSIYRAVSAAWPGRFQPWELGKVSSEYWQSSENVYFASKWIAGQEGIEEHEIVPAIRKRHLTAAILQKYSIGAALKRLCGGRMEQMFAPFFWKEHRAFLQEHKLLRKINTLKNSERKTNLLHFLLYGLFHHDVQNNSLQNIRRYERIAHRIQRRSILYSD